jgi:hypothetical protein
MTAFALGSSPSPRIHRPSPSRRETALTAPTYLATSYNMATSLVGPVTARGRSPASLSTLDGSLLEERYGIYTRITTSYHTIPSHDYPYWLFYHGTVLFTVAIVLMIELQRNELERVRAQMENAEKKLSTFAEWRRAFMDAADHQQARTRELERALGDSGNATRMVALYQRLLKYICIQQYVRTYRLKRNLLTLHTHMLRLMGDSDLLEVSSLRSLNTHTICHTIDVISV